MMERPTDCPLCFEELSATVAPLSVCGHWMHPECLKKHHKQECPICRRPQQDVTVTGKLTVMHTYTPVDPEPREGLTFDYIRTYFPALIDSSEEEYYPSDADDDYHAEHLAYTKWRQNRLTRELNMSSDDECWDGECYSDEDYPDEESGDEESSDE